MVQKSHGTPGPSFFIFSDARYCCFSDSRSRRTHRTCPTSRAGVRRTMGSIAEAVGMGKLPVSIQYVVVALVRHGEVCLQIICGLSLFSLCLFSTSSTAVRVSAGLLVRSPPHASHAIEHASHAPLLLTHAAWLVIMWHWGFLCFESPPPPPSPSVSVACSEQHKMYEV